MESLIVKCPKCAQELQVEADMAGSQVQCPCCSEIFELPARKPAVASVVRQAAAPAAANSAQQLMLPADFPFHSYLEESILCTMFCCLPAGIVGIINASKAKAAFKAGNYDDVCRFVKKAKMWCMIGGLVSLGFGAIYMVVALVSQK